jgi:pimeloyl-ACP methyl ester carboxylesterase
MRLDDLSSVEDASTMSNPRQWLAGATLCVLGASAAAAVDTEEFSIHLHPQRMVEVDAGRRLNLVCLGEGSPTVIFESGLAEPTSNWFKVQPEIAKRTQACSYDRAGVGFSDAPTRAGSSANAVDDLHRLLVEAGVPPPYVLVGHSYGGMHARLYSYTHPQDVLGLVLVDPTHEDQTEGYRLLSPRGLTLEQWATMLVEGIPKRLQCAKEAEQGFVRDSEAWKRCVFDAPGTMPPALQRAYLAMQQHPAFHLAQATEEEHVFGTSIAQLRAARRSFMRLPVVVLTQAPDPSPLRAWETPHLRAARTRMWFNLHQGLADASSRGVHRVVAGSDHSIHLTQPQAVIDAIEEVLAIVRKDPVETVKQPSR